MKKLFAVFSLIIISVYASIGQQSRPDSAQSILNSAIEKARISNKNVFIVYHATWCGWCSRLDSMLEESGIRKIMEDNFIITRLDVKERGEKIETCENPGANATLIKYEGEKSGLPFMVILNSKGKKIADSNVMPKKQNIGYPGSKEEISAFIRLIKSTAPRITKKQAAYITEYLKKNAPKD